MASKLTEAQRPFAQVSLLRSLEAHGPQWLKLFAEQALERALIAARKWVGVCSKEMAIIDAVLPPDAVELDRRRSKVRCG